MSTSPTKTQRWLDLIAFLAGRRFPVAVEQIMEGVPAYAGAWAQGDETARASVRRKFERDKDELRSFGIPIETLSYSVSYGREEVEGYRLADRDFYLPYLKLIGASGPAGPGPYPGGAALPQAGGTFEIDEGDAARAVAGLRRLASVPGFPLAREARSALRKLSFDLERSAPADAPVLYAAPPEAEELRSALRALSDALIRRKTVSFRYRGMYRDEVSERTVRPYGLLYQHAHWYLIGHDEGPGDLRVFRVGRMGDVAVNPLRANSEDFAIPEDFDMDAFAGREAWELRGDEGERVRARVRFAFPRSLWAERNGTGELVETHPDGSATRAFDVLQPEPFVRWILSLEGEAAVESPPELASAVVDLARRVAALYRGSASRA